MSKQSFTLREIADRWSCCHSSVLSLVRSGALQAIDISTVPSKRSHYIVPVEALEEFEASRTVAPSTPSKRRAKIKRTDVTEFIR